MELGKPGANFSMCAINKIVHENHISIVDTSILSKKLPVYDVISCIDNLLKQVVNANQRFYAPKKYFYSLSFKRQGDKRYLVIEVGRYKSSRVCDYVGAIKVGSSIFLCRGDITTDTLFKINKKAFLNVHLESAKQSDNFNYGVEPSLRGVYQECRGINISLEIYTRATLPGYKMEERKN